MPETILPPAAGIPPEDDGFEDLLRKIHAERNLDFRDYKAVSLRRRINKQLFANGLDSYWEYIGFLDSHPDEYPRLLDTVLINVSEFFRDPEAWEVIGSRVLPDIIRRKAPGETIRVWSAGCSTGEEPYTLGILLAEMLGEAIDSFEVKIYATDADEAALATARKGVYGTQRLKNLSDGLLGKYFSREGDCYKISHSIRRMVAFGAQNLVSDPPISRLDLLVCRNVQIYFNSELQTRLLSTFSFALNPGGYAFFGKSESLQFGSRMLKVVDPQWRVFQK